VAVFRKSVFCDRAQSACRRRIHGALTGRGRYFKELVLDETEALNGKVVDWMEKLSDEQYQRKAEN
jgi:hypothetical protein